MNTYKKPTALGLNAQSRYLQTSGLPPPPPLYKFEVVFNYFINRVSFAAIAVFLCPHATRRVAALRAIRVAYRTIWGGILGIDTLL